MSRERPDIPGSLEGAMGEEPAPDRAEEIRFAVVLNGGVSLAVWMGGVVHELDQLTREEGPYGRLMDTLGVRGRVDVIAGTSAGGINGAALALSQINEHADLAILRDLWAEQGRMETLLQRPFAGKPSSLLRGEEYFLPKLNEAMRRLVEPWAPRPSEDRPIDLTITTTLLTGAYSTTSDAFGQVLPQGRHDGQFRFFRGVDPAERSVDQFADRHGVADALGLAARCSAGFPVAFEPSFVPINNAAATSAHRPDMTPYATWTSFGPAGDAPADRSRFTVDGGVLSNTPTRQALEAIQRMKAGRRVQRVMLLVYPHAPASWHDQADRASESPVITAVMAGIMGALTSEGSRTFVNEVEAHNRRAASRRGTRSDILSGLTGAGSGPAQLHSLAERLFPHYANLRHRRVARDLAERVDTTATWSYERVRATAEGAQEAWRAAHGPIPYVPDNLPQPETPLPLDTWAWGTTSALDIADIALEIVTTLGDLWAEQRGLLGRSRNAIHDAMSTMRAVRGELDAPWRESPVLARMTPGIRYWELRLDFYSWKMLDDTSACTRFANAPPRDFAAADKTGPPSPRLQELRTALEGIEHPGKRVAAAVVSVLDALLNIGGAYRDLPRDQQRQLAPAQHWIELLGLAEEHEPTHERLFGRLLDLHVVSWTIGDEYTTDNTTPVDLVQISAQGDNDFAHQSLTLDDKLGGASLARFAGFLKRSWRMNDWTWGRCDAASTLVRVLVSPARIRRHANGREARDVVDELVRSAYELEDTIVVADWLASLPKGADWIGLHGDAVREVEACGDQLPDGLPRLTALLTWARHIEVVLDELPTLARAIQADEKDGANPRSRGALLVNQHKTFLDGLDSIRHEPANRRLESGIRALALFDTAGIGREPLEQERMSDQMIRTTVTAASVFATVADSPSAGLGRINPITRAVKGAMQVPYWVTLGLTAGGRIARFLGLLGLAVSGVLLALALLGTLEPPLASLAAGLGAGGVLLVLAYSAMRTGSLLHGLVLLSAGLPLAVLGFRRANARGTPELLGLGTAGLVLALVVGFVILGSLPHPLHSPMHLAAGLVPVRLRSGAALVLAAVLVAGVLFLAMFRGWLGGYAWIYAAVATAVTVGAWGSHRAGKCLRTWRWDTEAGKWDDTAPVIDAVGVTAGWSAVYGVAYLGISALMRSRWPEEEAAFRMTMVIALLLLLVVPGVAVLTAQRRFAQRLEDAHRVGLYRPPTVNRFGEPVTEPGDRLVAWLDSHDMTYLYLVDRRTDDLSRLELHGKGITLARRLGIIEPGAG